VTPVSEVGPYKFTPGEISRKLIEAYALETLPQEDEIAADISL
jgi:branched-chain amino acid aminotransferase